jgi:hypothetical protein
MARSIPAGLLTALTQASIQPYFAVEMLFDTAPVRFWSGIGNRTIDGTTYLGAGSLMRISDLEEVGDLSAKSATVTFSGIPPELVSLALVEPYQRRVCRILLGEVSASAAIEMFSGKMNTMTIEDAPDSATIQLTIESRLVELGRSKPRRYNHESHIARYPGDNFFSFVADLQDRQVPWGRKQV